MYLLKNRTNVSDKDIKYQIILSEVKKKLSGVTHNALILQFAFLPHLLKKKKKIPK